MKYKKIAVDIKEKILSGEYETNQKIQSEREFAIMYDTSKLTVRKALNLLVENGFVYVKPNSGYYVNDKNTIRSMNINCGVRLHEIYNNNEIRNEVFEFEIIKPKDFLCNLFNITPEDDVVFASRIRYINGDVRIIEETYMPKYLFEDINRETFENSVYEYIRSKGYIIQRQKRSMQATFIPEKFLKNHANLQGVPVLFIENNGYLEDGRCFEYSLSYSVSDTQTIIVDLSTKL